jgi:hypothetical protein
MKTVPIWLVPQAQEWHCNFAYTSSQGELMMISLFCYLPQLLFLLLPFLLLRNCMKSRILKKWKQKWVVRICTKTTWISLSKGTQVDAIIYRLHISTTGMRYISWSMMGRNILVLLSYMRIFYLLGIYAEEFQIYTFKVDFPMALEW